MKSNNEKRANNVIAAGITIAAVIIVAYLVMIFVNTSNLTPKEITNGFTATFEDSEAVLNNLES